MTAYTVQVVNNSKTAWKFFVYRSPIEDLTPLTLAWLATPSQIPNGGTTEFYWQTKYEFVWSAGDVQPEKIVKVLGQIDCDPNSANSTKFTAGPDPGFSDPVYRDTKIKGALYIDCCPMIIPGMFGVGYGMSGSASAVANVGPNWILRFDSIAPYNIAAIDEVEQGEVMDVKTITLSAEIQFPDDVYNMTATLKADDTWSITPSTVGQGAQFPQVGQGTKGAIVAQVKEQA